MILLYCCGCLLLWPRARFLFAVVGGGGWRAFVFICCRGGVASFCSRGDGAFLLLRRQTFLLPLSWLVATWNVILAVLKFKWLAVVIVEEIVTAITGAGAAGGGGGGVGGGGGSSSTSSDSSSSRRHFCFPTHWLARGLLVAGGSQQKKIQQQNKNTGSPPPPPHLPTPCPPPTTPCAETPRAPTVQHDEG